MTRAPTEANGGDGHPAAAETSRRLAADQDHRTAPAASAMVDTTPDEEDLLGEVHRLVRLVVTGVQRRRPGRHIPALATPSWWAAEDPVKVASLLVIAEGAILFDPQRAIDDRFKAMAVDLSNAADWTAAARRPSHAELQRRRYPDGDPERWVRQGEVA